MRTWGKTKGERPDHHHCKLAKLHNTRRQQVRSVSLPGRQISQMSAPDLVIVTKGAHAPSTHKVSLPDLDNCSHK